MASTSINIRDYHKEIPGGLSPDHRTWVFPLVSSTNSHGRITEWRIYVRVFKMCNDIVLPIVPDDAFIVIKDSYLDNRELADDLRGWIKVDSGLLGGKIRESIPTVVHKGKNIGKASATNVLCQTLRDALSLYNKQLKKTVGAANAAAGVTRYPPMLAQVLKDQKTPPVISETNPVYVQRKYNGVRTIATRNTDGSIILYSRRKLIYPGFKYIKDELDEVLKYYWEGGQELYMDGEIYRHGVALQDISGQARRETKDTDVRYDYMIYDLFVANEPNLIYTERRKILNEIFAEFPLVHCKEVETFEVTDKEEVQNLYKQFLDEGFEGAMVRINTQYAYSYNERHSKVLLKVKPSFDAELKVIDFTTGEKGKAAEALMIICETDDGKRFPVTPAMEIPDRIALAKKMKEMEPNGKTHFQNHWLNKKIIVTYDELSKDGVPQRARTKLEVRSWQ